MTCSFVPLNKLSPEDRQVKGINTTVLMHGPKLPNLLLVCFVIDYLIKGLQNFV